MCEGKFDLEWLHINCELMLLFRRGWGYQVFFDPGTWRMGYSYYVCHCDSNYKRVDTLHPWHPVPLMSSSLESPMASTAWVWKWEVSRYDLWTSVSCFRGFFAFWIYSSPVVLPPTLFFPWNASLYRLEFYFQVAFLRHVSTRFSTYYAYYGRYAILRTPD